MKCISVSVYVQVQSASIFYSYGIKIKSAI